MMIHLLFSLFLAEGLLAPSDLTVNLADHQIFRRGRLAVAPDGSMAILQDASTKFLLLLDAHGKFIAQCGQAGQGPGEFGSPDAVQWQGNEWVVYDSDNNRISRWDGKGALVNEVSQMARLRDPRFLDQSSAVFWKKGGTHEDRTFSAHLAKLGSETDSLIWQSKEPLHMIQVKYQEHITVVSPPWFAYIEFGVGRDFVAVTVGQTDQIGLYDFKGNVLGTIKVEMKTRPITDDDVNHQIEMMPPEFQTALRANRKQLTPYESYPTILSLCVDSEDRIWVTGPNPAEGKSHQVAVFSKAAKLLKQGTVPEAPEVVTNGSAYLYQENSDGDINLKRHPLTF